MWSALLDQKNDPSNNASKCSWSHVLCNELRGTWFTLRCHFLTTTKLSKNTRPTGFPNWRNTQFSSLPKQCQRPKGLSEKIFFGAFFPLKCPADSLSGK
jgi:hypothetical protein